MTNIQIGKPKVSRIETRQQKINTREDKQFVKENDLQTELQNDRIAHGEIC